MTKVIVKPLVGGGYVAEYEGYVGGGRSPDEALGDAVRNLFLEVGNPVTVELDLQEEP